MLAEIPAHEMAETLRVLAGANAYNAASHFTKRSYEIGDVASAVLWSSIGLAIAGAPPAAEAGAEPEREATPVSGAVATAVEGEASAGQGPAAESVEAGAFRDVRFEDVDAETLAAEAHAAEEAASIAVPPIPKRALALILSSIGEGEKPETESRRGEEPAAEIAFAEAA